MDNHTIICPVTKKTLQAKIPIDRIIALSSRDAPVAVWCAYCERSHLVPAESLVRGLHGQTPRPTGSSPFKLTDAHSEATS
jgi:hypothetical protein